MRWKSGSVLFLCPKLWMSETLKWLNFFFFWSFEHTLLHLKSESHRYVTLVESRDLLMPNYFI